MERGMFGPEHDDFRASLRDFLEREVVPHLDQWESDGIAPRGFYRRLGDLGACGITVPEEYGGAGVSSFLFNVVMAEEFARLPVHLGGVGLHLDVVVPYFLHLTTDEQKARWLPGIASGDLVTAIAMTEPGTGSDLAGITTRAVLEGDHYVLDGAKTFITGGVNADLVVVVARTSPDRHAGLTLLVVETGMPGFSRGRTLEKVGMWATDTAELFFEGVRVPVANRLGEEGRGFDYLSENLPQERLAIGVGAQAACVVALQLTIDYVTQRTAFGRTIADFQNTKFELASLATEIEAGQALVDRAVGELEAGRLSAADAAKVKLFCTELQGRVTDRCLQLFGGYGFMREYPIAKMWADARVTRIYGGTSEIMRVIIAQSLGLR